MSSISGQREGRWLMCLPSVFSLPKKGEEASLYQRQREGYGFGYLVQTTTSQATGTPTHKNRMLLRTALSGQEGV
jgi:hypothetical protein